MPALRLAAAQVAIGAAAIFARYALAGAGPLAVSALRLLIATAVLLAIARGFERLSRRRELAFALAGLALAAHFATWISSLAYTSVAIATLLVCTTPLWTEIYDVVRERRPPTIGFSIALVLGLGGVALIALPHGAGRPPVPGYEGFGDALAIAGSFAIGIYLLIVRVAAVDAGGKRLSTRQLVARTYGWATLFLVVAAAIGHEPPPPLALASAWGGILAMALISQLLGHTAMNAALADFSPSVISLTTLCEPVIAAILAAMLFSEKIGVATIAGGACVLIGVGVALREQTVRSRAGDEIVTNTP